jgi:putative MATE family efflux protein
MHDLTEGPIPRHIARLAAPMMAGMIFQTLYYLIDLYFVARLGDAAIAGVGAAGSVSFIVMAVTQVLGVGTMALIAHAVGRKDNADANLIYNQSLLMSGICAALTLAIGSFAAPIYMQRLGANPATIEAGTQYLRWFLPGLALQFAMITMGSALRGTGIAKPTMVVQIATVVLNAILAPILIAGWGTGHPMGVAGAGLATSASLFIGVTLLWRYFAKLEHIVGFDRALFAVRFDVWKRIFKIGLPPGGEFALMFLNLSIIYWIIRDFGANAQAGYGVGSRVMQSIFLPAMAIAFAAAPIAGQNMGAGKPDRVRATFGSAAIMGAAVMLLLTLFCQWQPAWFIERFTKDPDVVAVGAEYLRFISWNFVATGIIFTCSGMFQALGNTVPALLSGATRLVTFAAPAIWLSTRPGFTLRQIWMLSVVTTALQALASYLLLQREFRRKLGAGAPSFAAPMAMPVSEA